MPVGQACAKASFHARPHAHASRPPHTQPMCHVCGANPCPHACRAEPRHAGPHETQCARMRAAAASPTAPPGTSKDKPVNKTNCHCSCPSPRRQLGAARPPSRSGPAKQAQRQLGPKRVAANAVMMHMPATCVWREAGRTNERPRTPSECSAIRPPTSPH